MLHLTTYDFAPNQDLFQTHAEYNVGIYKLSSKMRRYEQHYGSVSAPFHRIRILSVFEATSR